MCILYNNGDVRAGNNQYNKKLNVIGQHSFCVIYKPQIVLIWYVFVQKLCSAHTHTYGGHLCVAYHLRLFDSWCALICAVLLPAFEVKIPVTFVSPSLSFTLSLSPHTNKPQMTATCYLCHSKRRLAAQPRTLLSFTYSVLLRRRRAAPKYTPVVILGPL